MADWTLLIDCSGCVTDYRVAEPNVLGKGEAASAGVRMQVLAHAERLLWAAGALSLGYCLVVGVQVRGSQNIAAGIGKQQQAVDGVARDDVSVADGVIGRIEIPALALS